MTKICVEECKGEAMKGQIRCRKHHNAHSVKKYKKHVSNKEEVKAEMYNILPTNNADIPAYVSGLFGYK